MHKVVAFLAALTALFLAPAVVAAGSADYPEADLNITQSAPSAPAGGTVTIRGEGADAGTTFDVYMTFSPERRVAGGTVAADGTFEASFSVPAGQPAGTYNGAVVASVGGNLIRSGFQVVVASSAGGLPASGSDSGNLVRLGVLAVLIGAAALAFAARRRHHART